MTAASNSWISGVVVVAAVLGAAANVSGQYYQDNFDSYAPDSFSIGQGDWLAWDGGLATTDSPIVRSPLSYSPGNSLEIGPAGTMVDTGWAFSGATSGLWEFRAMTYVPASSTAGAGFIGFMNDWPGTVDFLATVDVDMGANVVIDGSGGVTAPLVRDAWIEFRTLIDI
ncbi:MAG: hypothetical protein QGG25_05015, partial [Phycisphaerae bacterium]|nr:hypothetical protein [Phycisphaerae bacterium]